MKTPLRVGIIGCGGRGRAHALGYAQSDQVRIVACADSYPPAAERLAADFQAPRVYSDYRKMLEREALDIVSMALWPADHAPAVLDCVQAPHPPRLINAEKPMAPTFGEARRMHRACEEAGIALTFSHQRRFGPAFHTAANLIRAGRIGDLVRVEGYCPNLFDWGTHWFDMFEFFVGDLDPDWVMGQVDCAEENLVFGARMETSGLSYIKWPNGVTGLLATGANPGGGCQLRAVGAGGVIEILRQGGVRLLPAGTSDWEHPRLPDWRHPGGDTTRHILDSIDCLLSGRESILCSRNALRATELIFATYESARRRQKVLLPLDLDGSPLLEMLDSGEIAIPDWPAFLTETEEEQGWMLLFDGRTLLGWEAARGPAQAWSVRFGTLAARGTVPAELRSARSFTDFSLAFQWRPRTSRGRAAVALRCPPHDSPKNSPPPIQIQLMDDRGCPPSPESCGAVNAVLAPDRCAPLSPGGWAEVAIELRQTKLRVAINGETILDRDLQNIEAIGPIPESGRIALASCGLPVDFRDIRARPLPSEPA